MEYKTPKKKKQKDRHYMMTSITSETFKIALLTCKNGPEKSTDQTFGPIATDYRKL